MRPVPIPDRCVPPGCRRYTIGAPPGKEDQVRPVEAVAGIVDGAPRIAVLVELEDGDLDRLTNTGAVWLTFLTGQIPAFVMHVADSQDLDALNREAS